MVYNCIELLVGVNMKVLILLSFIFIYGCSSGGSGTGLGSEISGVWEYCSQLQNHYIEALKIKCGEDVANRHYNLIKTTSDKRGEYYYCKNKYNGYYGEIVAPREYSNYTFPEADWSLNKYTLSTCDELTPYIGKRLEEEIPVHILNLSLDNVKSCKALNNIFESELKRKCEPESESLISQHRNKWNNNPNYYCDEYQGTFVGEKQSSNVIYFPQYRGYCVEGLEELKCNELKNLIGKKLESNIFAHGYYEDYKGEIKAAYNRQCSILFVK